MIPLLSILEGRTLLVLHPSLKICVPHLRNKLKSDDQTQGYRITNGYKEILKARPTSHLVAESSQRKTSLLILGTWLLDQTTLGW